MANFVPRFTRVKILAEKEYEVRSKEWAKIRI